MEEQDITKDEVAQEMGIVSQIIDETVNSPVNLVLIIICIILIYKIIKLSRTEPPAPIVEEPRPKIKKQDMTSEELGKCDGSKSNRICVALNGKIFDMTRNGGRFYGPGGPYAAFAGHDATHALATFDMENVKSERCDISNFSHAEMESVKEWEMQFTEKYEYVGKLLKDGEQPTEYSDEEENKEGDGKESSSSVDKKTQ